MTMITMQMCKCCDNSNLQLSRFSSFTCASLSPFSEHIYQLLSIIILMMTRIKVIIRQAPSNHQDDDDDVGDLFKEEKAKYGESGSEAEPDCCLVLRVVVIVVLVTS